MSSYSSNVSVCSRHEHGVSGVLEELAAGNREPVAGEAHVGVLLVAPVFRGEVGHGYCHLFIVFCFLSSLFSHCILCH